MHQNFALHNMMGNLYQTVPRWGEFSFGLKLANKAARLAYRIKHEQRLRLKWWDAMDKLDKILIEHEVIMHEYRGTIVFAKLKPTLALVTKKVTSLFVNN